jgi:hypothetical protein
VSEESFNRNKLKDIRNRLNFGHIARMQRLNEIVGFVCNLGILAALGDS